MNRLTDADYSTGLSYAYEYDPVGNRLSQTTTVNGLPPTVSNSTYDAANRLTSIDNVSHTWDNNGNLLDDGRSTYTYDAANRLNTVSNTSGVGRITTYFYNGLGDRLKETSNPLQGGINGSMTTFSMDLASGLTQVLSEKSYQLSDSNPITYLYGNGRIAQYPSSGTMSQIVNQQSEIAYFLGDALGSVRQMTDASGAVTLAKNYDPYGQAAQSLGAASSSYGYTGEYQTGGMVYLRARMYAPYLNQFIQRDTIVPDPYKPMEWNRWAYAGDNPINYTDPSGHCREPEEQDQVCWTRLRQTEAKYPFIDLQKDLSSTNYWAEVELWMVDQDLELLDRASAIDLNQEFAAKEVRIRRERISKGNLCGSLGNQLERWFGDSSIRLYDLNFSNHSADQCLGTVNHELAHYWDFRDNISGQFEKYVGFSYFFLYFYIPCKGEAPPIYGGTLDVNEDFAESLSEYVLLNTNYSSSYIGIVPGEKRWKFIEALLDTGKILSPP